MLTTNRIDRLATSADFDRLLTEVLQNGRTTPLGVRLRLSESQTLPAAALGLAIQRLVELTFVPGEETNPLVEALLDIQQDDGTFGSTSATAVAVSALHAWLEQISPMRWYLDARRPGVDALVKRVETSLSAAMISLESGAPECDATDTLILAWQLGRRAALREWSGYPAVMRGVDRFALRHDRQASRLLTAQEPPAKKPGRTMMAA